MTETSEHLKRLYGTDAVVTPPRLLKAGPLTAEFEAGNLRYIRFDGIEMIRAISFIVRDRNWGTYDPALSEVVVEESEDGFAVRYDAVAQDASQAFRYRAGIIGRADGSLRFEAHGEAATDFETNRTGFVVLHPIVGVAGQSATVEHVDGAVVETSFPELINPVQPMMSLRAITHAFADGARVTCRMEGDAYEMEDQRNWTDASYKTYVRPLALPWPYVIPKGETLVQSVTLSVEGRPAGASRTAGEGPITIEIGEAVGPMPAIGAGLDPDDISAVRAQAEMLKTLGLNHVIVRHDPRRGHGRETLEQAVMAAFELRVEPWLEAVVAEVEGFEAEIAELGRLVAAIGAPFPVVLLSPAPDLKCTLPGSVWPPCPPLDAVYAAARAAFPDARIGGGMFSYFTEFNRKRPPLESLDLASFTTSALVHAGDDRSVMETLESLPFIAASARAIVGATPYAVGPSAIGMRDNPYGEAPMPNPNGVRQAMNRDDPRQQGQIAAAWMAGYIARFADGGASAIAVGGLMGPFGVLAQDGSALPTFAALRGLAAVRGQVRRTTTSNPAAVLALGVKAGDRTELWLANLTPQPRSIRRPEGWASAAMSVIGGGEAESLGEADVDLPPFAVAVLTRRD